MIKRCAVEMSQTTIPSGRLKYEFVGHVCLCYAFVNYILRIPETKMETTRVFSLNNNHKEMTTSHGPTVITKEFLILPSHTNTTIISGSG